MRQSGAIDGQQQADTGGEMGLKIGFICAAQEQVIMRDKQAARCNRKNGCNRQPEDARQAPSATRGDEAAGRGDCLG